MAPNSDTINNTTDATTNTSTNVGAMQTSIEDLPTNEDDKFIVKYRKNYYDITNFMHKHPGGINTLKGLNNSDMTARFLKAPPHSDAAMYLMKEYRMGKEHQVKPMANGRRGVKQIKENIEIVEEEERHQEDDDDKTNNNATDESMEHLVDWSKAMVPQISKITAYYDEWVHKPVDRPLRLFGPSYLEMCTKTPWWVVPTFWLPIIAKLIYDEFHAVVQSRDSAMLFLNATFFVLGILLWTFLEYTLHRYVFHMQISANTHPWLCTFHFIIHGLHHKVPFDPMRLVFPPLPGLVIATVLYTPLSILPKSRILLAGALFGYLCYDMMHYYLHYGNPSIKHLYHMKRYHYQHHFAHQDMGYGISSPLWDLVFDTRIRLRKLRFHLKWK